MLPSHASVEPRQRGNFVARFYRFAELIEERGGFEAFFLEEKRARAGKFPAGDSSSWGVMSTGDATTTGGAAAGGGTCPPQPVTIAARALATSQSEPTFTEHVATEGERKPPSRQARQGIFMCDKFPHPPFLASLAIWRFILSVRRSEWR